MGDGLPLHPVALTFAGALGLGPRTISRSAVAGFFLPLQTGAPDNVLGYAPFPTTMVTPTAPEGFYLENIGNRLEEYGHGDNEGHNGHIRECGRATAQDGQRHIGHGSRLPSALSGLSSAGITMVESSRRQHDVQLRHQAQYNALTGLPNRSLLHERLAQAFGAMQREGIWCAQRDVRCAWVLRSPRPPVAALSRPTPARPFL